MADDPEYGGALDAPGLVMRVRRTCDLSQRDLGTAIGLDHSQIARIESSLRRIDLPLLARILSLAGMRVAILDRDGNEVLPIAPDVLRDNAGRRMPAHLDVRAPSDRPTSALLNARYDRTSPKAWYHHRTVRDRRRNAGESDAIPDQPTVTGVAQRERERHADRLRRARHRAVTLLEVDCTCLGGCWEGRGCVDDCACRCEP
jgi:HTH-type transcriptional regulator/antitoxin HipB